MYRELFALNHDWLEATSADLTPEQTAWQPPRKAVPAGAHYLHHLTTEDAFIHHMFQGKAPLMTSTFAGTAGFSEPPPMEGAWNDWADRVVIDLPATRAYGKAVYAATDAYLAGLTDAELNREIDLSAMGMGSMKVTALINMVLMDSALHTGEISCIKGLQGAKGYPM